MYLSTRCLHWPPRPHPGPPTASLISLSFSILYPFSWLYALSPLPPSHQDWQQLGSYNTLQALWLKTELTHHSDHWTLLYRICFHVSLRITGRLDAGQRRWLPLRQLHFLRRLNLLDFLRLWLFAVHRTNSRQRCTALLIQTLYIAGYNAQEAPHFCYL